LRDGLTRTRQSRDAAREPSGLPLEGIGVDGVRLEISEIEGH
jgi:hypothetical protein